MTSLSPTLREKSPRPPRSLVLRGRAAWVIALSAAAAACGPATGGDPEFWAAVPGDGTGGQVATSGSTGGAGSTGAAGGAGGTGAAGGAGGGGATGGSGGTTTSMTTTTTDMPPADPALAIDFTTVTFGGKYSPRNVGAVWITDSNNKFVKTLQLWAAKRAKYLVKWKASSGGNVVDAVTSATKSSHGPHHDTWNGTDVNHAVVPDGLYHLNIEFTEQDAAGKSTVIDFQKSTTPVDISPPDEPNFTKKHLLFSE